MAKHIQTVLVLSLLLLFAAAAPAQIPVRLSERLGG